MYHLRSQNAIPPLPTVVTEECNQLKVFAFFLFLSAEALGGRGRAPVGGAGGPETRRVLYEPAPPR